MFLSLKIFEMMDAKARQDCIKEIDLLKVRISTRTLSEFWFEKTVVFRSAAVVLALWHTELTWHPRGARGTVLAFAGRMPT